MTRDYLRAHSSIGRMMVSKTIDLGSNPSGPVFLVLKNLK